VARQLGREPSARANNPRHDTLGYLLWSELADPKGERHAPAVRLNIVDADGATPDERLAKKALRPWIAAVAGHHGRPPEHSGHASAILGDHFGLKRPDGAWVDALAFVNEARAILQPAVVSRCRTATPIDESAWKTSSWWLAGYATLCDWVGSSTEWFPFQSKTGNLRGYWSVALERAGRAVQLAGLGSPCVRSFGGFRTLFAEIAEPSPLQVQVSTVQLGDGPQLLLLEDLTGSGKTEAALALVGRLFDAGKADGFYFALPTMATSNAMFSRVEPVIDRLFEAKPPPSFLIAHSGPKLRGRAAGIGAETLERQPGSTYGADEATASELARSWLLDSRKKALLADAGVGTVDQALMGALQAKHNSLRLLGLHRHVLVVDEVHACDEYMNGILMELLRVQAAGGGSAVLLSATLPIDTRRKLVEAFREGLGAQEFAIEGEAYPVLVRADRSGVEVVPVTTRKGSERPVKVEFLETFDEVARWCRDRAKAGKCVAWIRNTVRDALEAFDRLAAELGPGLVQLFHARFPMGDRLKIEQDVVLRFGPASVATERKGRIVVSTQVLEQSLDLDFDEMVSDLAPIDRLIQRAGRLHRHPRGQRGDPILHVLAPPWNEQPPESWPGDAFNGSVAVYGRPSLLWRTQRILQSEARLELPAKARLLVEAVYGADDSFVPDSLLIERRELKSEGEELRNRAMAQHNKIRLEQGFVRTGTSWADDEFVPTRLGDPMATLRLVRAGGETIEPWSAATDVSPQVRWRLGEVSVRTALAHSGRPDEDAPLRARLKELGAEPPAHVVPIEMRAVGEAWHGRAIAARGADRQAPVTIIFTLGRGLDFRSEKGA
jgi:CRISPR-associated endonuclease/helicase Cas3